MRTSVGRRSSTMARRGVRRARVDPWWVPWFVDADDLTVDAVPAGADEVGDGVHDHRPPVWALETQRHGVDGDVALAQLVGEDTSQLSDSVSGQRIRGAAEVHERSA